jgi:hypothetical protein
VTLVHGTFAREADWVKDDSFLSRSILDSLGAETTLVVPFSWSGSNSHAARILAGEELRQHLHRLQSIAPSARHHIIAHSHGGNVVLYATRNRKIRNLVESVVFLGTPFIHAAPRTLSEGVMATSIVTAVGLSFFVVFIILTYAAKYVLSILFGPIPLYIPFTDDEIMMLSIVASIWSVWRVSKRYYQHIIKSVFRYITLKQIWTVRRLYHRPADYRTLCIYVRWDEAQLWLQLSTWT